MSDIILSPETFSKWMFWKKRRYVVAALAFLGFINLYTLRANLSIAIVAMTENRSVTLGNSTTHEIGYDWDSKLQGYILGSFFYGYMTTQLFGGWLSAKIGGKRIFGTAIFLTAVLTLFTEIATKISVYLLIVLRVLEGVCGGVTYPCIHAVWSRWAPPIERTKLATIAFSGSYFGTVIAMPLSAYLATAFGWPWIFYFFGVAAIIWYLFWTHFVTESPAQDPRITEEELQYIKESLGNIEGRRNIKHPWKKLFSSGPVWAIISSHFVDNWGFYFLLTQLPKFMKDMYNYSLNTSGGFSSIPYLVMAIVIQFSGQVVDWVRKKKYLTTTQARKVVNCGAFLLHAVFMMIAVFVPSEMACITFLSLAFGFGVCCWSGFGVNYLDIAPQHASVIMGIGNTIATTSGIFAPIATGYIVTTPTPGEWQIAFSISAALYVTGAILYALLASGTVQPWAVQD